ncbi:hypothetical protein P7D81_21730, partial [Enterococcus avium]|nr:hypothetical protein [Enterococcus avium]MDT2416361.1 hypothetical protein [Enterococcus avium]MDT2446827.1 hypothetical protein [Enterococcus avium]MDT2477133.1 hypothetical protein [Enterococcus avium]
SSFLLLSFSIILPYLIVDLKLCNRTIKGMEAIRGIYKKSRKEGSLFGFSVCTEIKGLLGIPA